MRKHVKVDLLTPKGSDVTPQWQRQLWGVAESYTIKNNAVFPQGAEMRPYQPLTTFELPTELQRIATGGLSPLEFARQFGLLGYGRLVGTHASGDPIPWVTAHARTIHFCLHFMGMLEEGSDEGEIRHDLKQFPDGPYAWEDKLVEIPLRYDLSRKNERDHGYSGFVPAAAVARVRISSLISENIGHICRRLFTNAHATRIESIMSFRAMIEAVYWQLADRLEGGGVRRCLECNQFFVARDKRQQYCPPWPGSTRSRCSARRNVQHFRNRQREENP